MVCASCGEDSPAGFRWCGFCGAELSTAVASEGRKVVTLVFADVTGSTALAERLDAESVRWIMSRFFADASEVLERHGGTVEKFIGDAVMAVFGIPRVREDDALRGVRAAAELRDRVRDLGQEVEARYGTGFGVRIGVNTGEVVAGDASARQAFATGDAVNVAARLEQAAASGEVVIGEGTLRLVQDAVSVEELEPLQLKGKSEIVAAWRLVEVTAGATGVLRRLDAPLIGRDAELATLHAAWQRTVDDRAVQVVTIAAPAGGGKTRLVAELVEAVQADAHVLTGSCLAYGEGITYWPVAEAIRSAAQIGDDDSTEAAAAKLAALLDGEDGAEDIREGLAPALGHPGVQLGREETFWAIRRLFETLARRRPLVIVLDDLHWAEETLLELIDYLAGWTRGVPLLLVCTARPETLERLPPATGHEGIASAIMLEPLNLQAAGELMLWQLDSTPLPAGLQETILATSEGNPLFVQELVRMLIEDRLVTRRNGSWQPAGPVASLAMPPTIQALLAARLDQLGAAERDVAQRASVVGHVFWPSAVRELCDAPSREDVNSHLQALVEKGLISVEAGPQATEEAFRFGHILIRDAAYAGLAKRTRAELHERFADWAETARSSRLTEFEQILGYHLEQAATYGRELGHMGDVERVAPRASTYLTSAGHRAIASGDFPAAANLLDRGASLLPTASSQRLAVRFESIPALVEAGQFEQADTSIAEILGASRDELQLTATRAWRAFLAAQRNTGTFEECTAAAEMWHSVSEQAGDHAGQGTALGFLAKMQFWAGQASVAEKLWLRAADQARLAGDAREEAESLVWLLIAGMFGPTPVTAALERCSVIENRGGTSRKVRVMASIERGVLEAMRGDTDRGRELVAEGRRQLEELGLAHLTTVMAQEAATVEELAREPRRAEELLRASVDRFERMGERGFLFTHTGLLTNALQEQGRFEEAAILIQQLHDLNNDEDLSFYSGVVALQAAHAGRDTEAIELAEAALEYVAATDFLRDHADRLVDLADVHALAGRRSEALRALAAADALYEQKGCVAAKTRTAQRRARLQEAAEARKSAE
jgi:class 3 adenylate cyclase/tetratricopeptide (TPR) repeat protein